jgi:hypothetical protein
MLEVAAHPMIPFPLVEAPSRWCPRTRRRSGRYSPGSISLSPRTKIVSSFERQAAGRV